MTLYRIVKTQMVDGDQYAMDGAMYMGRLVPVEPDYDEAKDALDLIDAYLSIVRSILGIGETP